MPEQQGYPHDPTSAVFFVAGLPKSAGSKRGFIYRGKADGKQHVAVVDASGLPGKTWRNDVRAAGYATWRGRPLLYCPIRCEFNFFLPRPKSHYGFGKNSGKVKLNMPPFPGKKPDALKLARSVEDALTGVIWRDDSLSVTLVIRKRWGDPGVWISVRQETE